MNQPKITIVTPNYNMGEYLEKTILTILNQEYPNLEYIIIDGGSTDDSIDIIKKYEKHLTYWESEEDQGMYHAIQKGFERGTGEIMGWLNSDDMLHPNALSTVSEIFSKFQKVQWLQGRPTSFDEKDRTVNVGELKSWSKYHFYLGNYKWVQQESTFWRRTLWEEAGSSLNLNLKYAGDFELWLRFFRHAELFSTSALIGGFRYRTTNQISKENLSNYLQEAEECITNELRKLSMKEQKKIKYLKLYQRINQILRRTKILNNNLFERKILNKSIDAPPLILFDVNTQTFYLGK